MLFNRKSSVRRKLVLMFLGSTILVHIIVGDIAEHMIKAHFYDLTTKSLETKFEGLSKSSTLDYTDPETISRYEKVLVNIWNIKDQQVTFQNSPTSLPPDVASFFLRDKTATYVRQWKDDNDYYHAVSFFVDDHNTLVIGLNINHHIEFFEAVNTLIFWFTLIVSILAGIYSVVIVNRGLRPLKQFKTYLDQIRPGKLDIRIPTEKLPSELEALGQVQNSMLDRLDLGFQRLSDFSTDIAHELRTPLTNMTTQTQVALSQDRDSAEYRDILGSNLEELERINKTINDTLYLAKAENLLLYQNKEQLDLNKEITQLIEYHQILADDKAITIELSGDGELYVDKHMLQRAINNLLSNAIRHASEGSVIHIAIRQLDSGLSITIANTGDTISKASLPFIFDRFYRGDSSRENDCSIGAGLGLAITKSIIETYDGTITAQSEAGETCFEIHFPPSNPA
ncbi:heavy metal sensor histidine kinase [Leucothrix mucor]|uniref:heavy metal sensor histidine kinase n=1 Tax=Leucothrix mucor TaxID=45248 RepID=UPI0003B6CD2C|nr:heavy metal sensor histidine kinase [Leucothrix mucor]